MTPTDWMMLVLSFYLHDFGMLVTEDEISNKDNNKDFLITEIIIVMHRYLLRMLSKTIYVIIMERESVIG